MSISAVVRALVNAGATPAMILAAVEAAEQEAIAKEEARKAKGRDRVRRHREAKRDVTDCNVTRVTPHPPVMVPRSPFPDPIPNPPLNPPSPDAADDAREPDWIAAGKSVIAEMGLVWGDPRWTGHVGRVRQWLADGYDLHLDILPTIASVMAKRGSRGPPSSISYFDRAIADARASRIAPMPIGIPQTSTRPANDIAAAFDRLDDRIAQARSRHRGPD